MWRMTMRGPAGGPAELLVCLVSPEEARRVGARRTLSRREKQLMRRRRSSAARDDFLAGRLAAHELIGQGHEILTGRHGEPVVARGAGRERGFLLSIAHSRGFGMAGLAAGTGWHLGVDIETGREMSRRLVRTILTEREWRRVARAGAGRTGRGALEHWALKEAALKAIGGGITVASLRSADAIEVVRLSRRGWGRIRLPGSRQARGRLISRRQVTMAVVVTPR